MARIADVILFKPSGKYYTGERWTVPKGAIGPYAMGESPDFRRIGGGAVLVPSQEPWGFPHLFPAEASWPEGERTISLTDDEGQLLVEALAGLSARSATPGEVTSTFRLAQRIEGFEVGGRSGARR